MKAIIEKLKTAMIDRLITCNSVYLSNSVIKNMVEDVFSEHFAALEREQKPAETGRPNDIIPLDEKCKICVQDLCETCVDGSCYYPQQKPVCEKCGGSGVLYDVSAIVLQEPLVSIKPCPKCANTGQSTADEYVNGRNVGGKECDCQKPAETESEIDNWRKEYSTAHNQIDNAIWGLCDRVKKVEAENAELKKLFAHTIDDFTEKAGEK